MSDETENTPEVDTTPEVEATPVVAQPPSSEAQTPEFVEEVEREPVSLEDAARRLAALVYQHRTVGDEEVAVALADVEAALPQDADEA